MKRILIVFITFLSLSLSAQEVLLRVNYKKGDKYLLKMELNQSLGITGGMKMKAEMVSNITSVMTGAIIRETRINQIAVDIIQGKKTLSYDSNTKEENLNEQGKELKKQFQPMMEAVISQVVNRYGQIVHSKVEPKVPGMDNFNEPTEYPEEPVKVGSTWSSEVSDDDSGTINMKYKVDKITDTTLFASITGSVSDVPGSTVEGSLEVDILSGNPNKVEVTISAKLENGGRMSVKTSMISKKI